jgi:hypothetical protein
MVWVYRSGDSFFEIPDEDGETFQKFVLNRTISNAEVNGMVNSFASNLHINLDEQGLEGYATRVLKLTKPQAEELLGEPNLSSNWDDWVYAKEPTQLTFLFGLKFNVDVFIRSANDFYTVGVYYFQDHLNKQMTCVFSVSEQEDMGVWDVRPPKDEKLIRKYIYEPKPQRYPIQVAKLVKDWLTNRVNENDFAYDLPKYLPFYFLNYDDGRLSFDGIKIGIKHEDFVKLLGYRGGVKGVSGKTHNRTNPLRYL